MSFSDSRFRGNDKEGGNDKKGGHDYSGRECQ